MKSQNASGFSIIQALIGTFILGIVSAAFMSFLDFANKSQKNVQYSVDFDLFKTSLNLVFNTKACDGAFYGPGNVKLNLSWLVAPAAAQLGQNILAAPLDIDKIMHGTTVVARLHDSVPPGSTTTVKLNKLQLTEAIYDGEVPVYDPVTTITTVYKAFSSIVEIEAKKTDNSAGVKVLKSRISARLLARASGTGSIERCANPTGTTCVDIPDPRVNGNLICGNGASAVEFYPIAQLSTQRYCSERGYAFGTVQGTSNANGNYTYFYNGAWKPPVGCANQLNLVRCCF